MASIKVKYRASSVENHEGTIYYQIIHDRKVRQLNTSYNIRPEEWDEKRSVVRTTQSSERKILILSIRERIRWDIVRLNKIVKKLDDVGLIYTADDVVAEFKAYTNEYSVLNYMERLIITFKQNGRTRTAETYRTALNSFRKFREDEDLMLDCLNSQIMEAYEAWLQNRGNTPNTSSFYIRILRAVYNRAVEEEIIENHHPFRRVYTGVEKTVKRAVSLKYIKKIKALNLPYNSPLDYARDMFLMSFYLRGMSFVDMAFLKKSDLKNGYIRYRRRKTGQLLVIEWRPEMQNILDKYLINPTQYLLPIIKSESKNERYAYRNSSYNINRNLKIIANMVGLNITLTMYVARHSWASAAKTKNIPLSIISEGMGHDSETTTKIYLASLDNSIVDEANSIIVSSL